MGVRIFVILHDHDHDLIERHDWTPVCLDRISFHSLWYAKYPAFGSLGFGRFPVKSLQSLGIVLGWA